MEENKKIEKKSSTSINYNGEIKVTIKKGNKVCSVKKYKNNGRWPLFYFLDSCLKGDYILAEKYRPKYINLYCAGAKGAAIPTISDVDIETQKIKYYMTSDSKITLTTYPYASSPDVEKVENEGIGSASITYHFTIPFTHLNTNASKPINLVGLFCTEYFDRVVNNTEPSAFFFVADSDNPATLGSLVDTGLLSSTKNNEYNIFIDWKLTFTNPAGN